MHLHAVFLFAREIGKFFALTALDLLNNSMTTQHKHFKNIIGGSQNYALPMYIR
jgi:hypothetical protein